MKKRNKNRAAVALGRLGGKAKTSKPKGFAALSKEICRKLGHAGGKATQKKRRTKRR